MTPLSEAINSLVLRITVCERGQSVTEEVTTLKVAIAVFQSDMDQLMSTDMSMVFGYQWIWN